MNVLVQLKDDTCCALAAFYDPTNFGSDPVAGLRAAFPSIVIPDDLAIATKRGIYADDCATWVSPDWVYLEGNLFSLKDPSIKFSLPETTAIRVSRTNSDVFWSVSTLEKERTTIRRFQLRSSLAERLDLSAVDAVTRSVIGSLPDDESRKWFAATVASLLQTPYTLIFPERA
jgi:hypothetical protein